MKQLFFFLIVAALLAACAASPTSAPAATPKPISIRACVADYTESVRRGPGKEFEVVGRLASGTCMQILGRNQDARWVYIQTEDNSTGWISATFLTTEGNVSHVPVRINLGADVDFAAP